MEETAALTAIVPRNVIPMQHGAFELEISPERAKRQILNRAEIQAFIKESLMEGVDFGKVEGCGDKPSLWQPGAQKICSLCNVYQDNQILQVDLGSGHREYQVNTSLRYIGNDCVVAKGAGSCSTMESKYRYRGSGRTCPKCGSDAIRSSKAGGFFCGVRNGGCGASFGANDSAITAQRAGKVENRDIADTYNTVLKMAVKRANVAATLNLSGGLSDQFSQDLEDLRQNEAARRGDHTEDPEPEPEQPQTHPEQRKQFADLLDVLIDEAGVRNTDRQAAATSRFMGLWTSRCDAASLPRNPAEIEPQAWLTMFEAWAAECRQVIESRRGNAAASDDPAPQSPSQGKQLIEEFNKLMLLPSVASMGEADAASYVQQKWEEACSACAFGTNPDELRPEDFGDVVRWMKRIINQDEAAFQKERREAQ